MQTKTTLGRKVLYAVIIVTGIYLVLCIGLTVMQRRLLYFPCKTSFDASRVLATNFSFEPWRGSNAHFIGWKRASKTQPGKAAVLIVHGNAGCALDRVQYAESLQGIAPLDVFLLEYPGYDGRPGSPSQKSLFAAAHEGLQQLGGYCQVFVIGESLGTGVATFLAGTHPARVTGLFLAAPYNNLSAVARHHLPIFPVKPMLRDKFPSDVYLKSYRGPVGVLLAGKDEVVPNKFGRLLYDGYRGPKKLWISTEAGHDDLVQLKPEFWREVLEFWKQGKTL